MYSIGEIVQRSQYLSADTLELSRIATGRVKTSKALPPPAPAREVGSIALAFSPESVFGEARRRIRLVFRLNLGITVALALILLGGISGSVILGGLLEQSKWALIFGGVSVADLLGVYAFKPLKAIYEALFATQRLDTVHLRLYEQLRSCTEHENLSERINCQTQVWEAIQRELTAISSP